MKTLIVEAVLNQIWGFLVSFLSNHSPSHLCVPDALILVPLGGCMWHSSVVSSLRAVVGCMTSDFGSSKANAFSSPHVNHVSTASSSTLTLSAGQLSSVIRQMPSTYDGQLMFLGRWRSSVKGGVRYNKNRMG
jgi:hypothetical protein